MLTNVAQYLPSTAIQMSECQRKVAPRPPLARGYDGWYVLEQDTTHKHPKDAAATNLRYIRGLGS